MGSEFRTELRTLGFDPTEALHGLLSLFRAHLSPGVAGLRARPPARPSPVLGAHGRIRRLALAPGKGRGGVELRHTSRAPEYLDSLALSTTNDAAKNPGLAGATAALTDPSISRLRTAYEYAAGSGLTLSLGLEEIARRGSNLLPLDAATLTSLGVGYRLTPSASVRVSYSLLDYQNYISDTPPVREGVAEASVSIEF